jgi:signal transduction histidine kinase
LFFCIACLILIGQVSSEELREVVVAVPRDFPPQYSIDAEGRPKGMVIDILDAVARIANIRFNYVVMDNWDDMLTALLEQQVDLIPNSGLSRSRMMDYGIIFTDPLERLQVKTFVLKEKLKEYEKHRYTDLKVGTVRSSFALLYLKRIGVQNITLYESIPDCVFALLSGEVEVSVYPENLFLKVARDAGVSGRIAQTGETLFESKPGLAVSAENQELVTKINAAIEAFYRSKLSNVVFQRWYEEESPYWSAGRAFSYMILLVFGFAAFFLLWRFRLHKNIQEQLNASERRFMAQYNSIPSPTYTWQFQDNDFVLVNYNNASMRVSNNKVSENVGKSISEIYPESRQIRFLVQNCLLRQCNLEKEIEISSHGKTVIYQISCAFVPPDLVLMHSVDVTTRKAIDAKEKEYRSQLQSLASALTNAEEKERRRIATELHDTIGQNLALSKIRLVMLSQNLNDQQVTDEVSKILEALDQSIQMTRNLTFEMGTPVLYRLGFEPSVNWLAEKLFEEHSLEVVYSNYGLPDDMEDELKAFLFRALRELLMNVVKHAQTSEVKVSTSFSDQRILRLTVTDHGKGFNSASQLFNNWKDTSFGLFSLKERLKPLGGHIDIYSKIGQGTKVTLLIPVDAFHSSGA